MNTQLDVETSNNEQVASSVQPSLKNNERVTYSTYTGEKSFHVGIEADRLGVLRGCTDSAFRLIMLADKIHSKEV
jgi:tRNA threonylcarbamoyladenosine modification (KEOPS) complex  Pcc1 subunit